MDDNILFYTVRGIASGGVFLLKKISDKIHIKSQKLIKFYVDFFVKTCYTIVTEIVALNTESLVFQKGCVCSALEHLLLCFSGRNR